VKANLATVLEDVIGHTADSHLHTALTVSVEPVKFKLARNHPCDVIAISSCTSTSAVNVGCKLVELLAVLISNDGASCGSSISSNGHSSVEYDTADGGSRLGVASLV